ncbi:MAG: class I SAM-dependent methyltransferase [Myxococcales bacterium]|nr:class I SAM-dependent methyltransferase [Myxococcales bacterium]
MPLEQTGIDASTLAARRTALQAAVHRVGALEAVQALGGSLANKKLSGSEIALAPGSFDLCHSGNALEHYPPTALRRFLEACVTALRPGGIASHVVDHRDHLHHVDRTWPFLLHRSLPDRAYQMLFGHELLYHNRLTPTQMMSCLESVGLERIMVRRAGADLFYKMDEEVLRQSSGVPAWTQKLPACARGVAATISPLDARTTYAHYVYRKR